MDLLFQDYQSRKNISRRNVNAPRLWLPRWAEMPGFKDRIILDEAHPYTVKCSLCDTTLVCYTKNLSDHVKTRKHIKKCAEKNIPVILDFELSKHTEDDNKITVAKIQMAAVFADLNISYNLAKPLLKILEKIDKNSIYN